MIRVQISGKHMELGDALRSRIADEMTKGIGKYFARPAEAFVTVRREGHSVLVDCSIHLASGMLLQAEGSGGDAHAAFSNVLDKVETRIRRYKNRLKDHHADRVDPAPAEAVRSFVIRGADADDTDDADDQERGDAPLVIAETTVDIRTMSTADAVLQLELLDKPALLFRNAAHGGINMVYRRADGHVGWVEAERRAASGADAGAAAVGGTPRPVVNGVAAAAPG
jgi:ribosomal subunit interface protein